MIAKKTMSKTEQLELLKANGFTVVSHTTFKGRNLTDDMLAKFLNERRDDTDYAIDGVVIEVDDANKRASMDKDNTDINPKSSIKYKVADADNLAIATVKGIEWAVSKHGYLKPRINVEPTELVGVTVQYCTGFNAKFIHDNKIQPGTKIKITRSGDVVPLCLGVAEAGPLK